MKTFCKSTLIAVILFFCSNGIQAQTTHTKLNQVELFRQLTGTWKSENAKDTTAFGEAKSYGTGLEVNLRVVAKGNIVVEGKELLGYDKRIDKFIQAEMVKGMDIEIVATWFISKNKYVSVPYGEISTPETASIKWEGEFKSPEMIMETTIVNNEPVKTYIYTRIKQ
jgi:hypothetical protein